MRLQMFNNLIYFLRLSKPFLTSKLEFIRHISNACNQVEEPVVKVLTEQKKKRTPAVLVVPTLTSQRIQEISSVTGISVGFSHISWVKFGVPNLELLEWNAKTLPDDFRIQTIEPEILKYVYNLKNCLPTSDLYVMETFSIRGKEFYQRVNEIHLSSMLTVILNGIERGPDWKDKVVFQKKIVLNKLFGLLIGSERMSATQVVDEIVNKTPKSLLNPVNYEVKLPPRFESKFLCMYNGCGLEKKEDLSLAFLLALSFIEVNIFKNEISLQKIGTNCRLK